MRSLAALVLVLGLGVAACDEEGPIERAGEEVDEAIEDVANGGERAGNRLDDAVDDVRDGVRDARDELRD